MISFRVDGNSLTKKNEGFLLFASPEERNRRADKSGEWFCFSAEVKNEAGGKGEETQKFLQRFPCAGNRIS